MSAKMLKFTFKLEKQLNTSIPLLIAYRNGHTLRGKPAGVAKTLEQRLAEKTAVDPELAKKINIGFPKLRPPRSTQLKERLELLKKQRQDSSLERLSRIGELEVNLKEINDIWLETSGPFQIRDIAEYYGVYEHLFGAAYFIPRIPLNISYKRSDGTELAVHHGNTVKPSDANVQPNVEFNSKINLCGSASTDKTLWTLIMTNPDGHFKEDNKEYIHWFIANIPDGNLMSGNEIIPYLQPFPPRGTGFHRHIFILYKQEKHLDFSTYSVKEINNLTQRTFSTFDFYKQYQDNITPAGLAFFQSDWDATLPDFYHKTLGIKEPIYEYDFPKPYVNEQTWFPIRQPFNLYLDKYRDPKEIEKEFILRKLSETHPSNGPETRLRFPNAKPFKNTPSWLKTEKMKSRLGMGRINDYKI